ncbi:MAG: hypothetical protein ACP5M5_13680 [Acidibrevibacterium sp.]|uniref:hypothetical protein n=1 Tax=Acidibrevibacterium sp. TaxID=2606776 RepID=UPI003D009F6E
MSQAVDALSTPPACVPSPDLFAFPDAALFDLRVRWERLRADRGGLPAGADAAPLAAEEATVIAQILAAPAHTLAGLGAKIEAAAIAPTTATAGKRICQVVEESAPVLERVFAAAPGLPTLKPMIAVMARILAETVNPEASAQGDGVGEGAAPAAGLAAANDGEPIEFEILYRALCGWVAVLAALQLSLENNVLPPAALSPVLTEMVEWRGRLGATLSAEERGANF